MLGVDRNITEVEKLKLSHKEMIKTRNENYLKMSFTSSGKSHYNYSNKCLTTHSEITLIYYEITKIFLCIII